MFRWKWIEDLYTNVVDQLHVSDTLRDLVVLRTDISGMIDNYMQAN